MPPSPLERRSFPIHVALPCGAAGLPLLLMALFKTAGLKYEDASGRLTVALLLLLTAALALALLYLGRRDWKLCLFCLLPVAAAFFLRVLLLDHVTYDYYDFLSKWAAFFRDNGGFAAIKLKLGDYNVPYLYFLAAISYVPVSDFYLIKLFSILFDVLLAWGGFRLARALCPAESRKPVWCFCLLLLLPTVILNGACWSQCDAIYGALALHAFASALDRRPKSSVVLIAVAFSFKLQTVFLLPLWGVLWISKRVKFSHLWLFPLTYLGTILPALLLGKPLMDILGVYFGQAEQYSGFLTLNAPSLYALIPYGMEVDNALFSRLGILAAFVLVLAVLLVFFLVRDRVTDRHLMTAAVILAVGVPLLLPSMHDRYFFLADVLTLVWACVTPWRSFQAAAVQIASLGGYHAYLKLQYLYPMAWGALLLLAVLVSAAVILGLQLRPAGKPRNMDHPKKGGR